MKKIFPSLLAAQADKLEQIIEELDPYCAGFHIDVMDNVFVPNSSWSADEVNRLNDLAAKPLWVHLMVEEPMKWIRELTLTPGSIVSYHFESHDNHRKIAELIKEHDWRPSIAISPKTPVESITGMFPVIDHILVMSVEPGFAGQPFIKDSIKKVEELAQLRLQKTVHFDIGIDGGITRDNIAELAQKGVDDFAVGSAVFKYEKPVEALQILDEKLNA